MLPMSDQEIFHLVEEKVYRVIGSMLAEGFPITEFVGGRKNKDSLYTKLLSKREAVSAQIFDKLRFRIVTRERDDIFPIVQYLQKKLFPFNYVIPSQSINSIFHFKRYCQQQRPPEVVPGRDAGRRRRGLHAERQRLLGRQLPGHPLRRRHAGAPAAQAPRARAVERVVARAGRLRHLRVPGHRPRDRGGERAGRGVARKVQGSPEEGRHPPPPARHARDEDGRDARRSPPAKSPPPPRPARESRPRKSASASALAARAAHGAETGVAAPASVAHEAEDDRQEEDERRDRERRAVDRHARAGTSSGRRRAAPPRRAARPASGGAGATRGRCGARAAAASTRIAYIGRLPDLRGRRRVLRDDGRRRRLRGRRRAP